MILHEEIAQARRDRGITQAQLAGQVGSTRLNIVRMEQGVGSVALLLAVMAALQFRVAGVGRGANLPEQLCGRRQRLKVDRARLGAKVGLDRRTVEAVETGRGTIASLALILDELAPRAKRSEPPRSSWSYDHSGYAERDKRFTPRWFLDHIVEAFGAIDLDPCGHEQSAVEARRKIILPQCGLASSWEGTGLAFVNPPYSAVSRWMARAADAWDRGEAQTIVMLVPARTDSEVYQKRVSRDADTLFLAGRIRFESTAGLAWPAPFSLMVLIWGATEQQIARFVELAPSVRMRPWGIAAITQGERQARCL